jgi:hypothetical protein
MHVDFKITTWERVEFDEEHNEAVKKAIENGEITSAEDLFNFLADRGDANVDLERLEDVDEQMSVEENDGCSTVQVWEGDELIWENGE